jgi:ketosteroid isomerase-like protein
VTLADAAAPPIIRPGAEIARLSRALFELRRKHVCIERTRVDAPATNGTRMMTRLCLALILLLGAVVARADAAADNTAAEKQIRAALAHWVAAANRGDYKAALDVWAPDLIGWPPQGPDDTYDREASGARPPSQPATTTYALTINEVIVDGSLAVVRDTWTQTTRQDSGPDKVATFRSYEVWRRQPDRTWKISRWIDGPMMPASGKT